MDKSLLLMINTLDPIIMGGSLAGSLNEIYHSQICTFFNNYRDLAQILLREGDLQRLNGRYSSAIQDYATCLELRKTYLSDPWDRRIADTQYNLGLTYLSNSSDLQKETTITTTITTIAEGTIPVTPNASVLAKEHCIKGIVAYVECAKTLSGILARSCGQNPETLLSEVSSAKSAVAGFKTTGLDDDIVSVAEASQTLNIFRKAVTALVAHHLPKDTAAANSVNDIQQVLDEIQETVDEAERAMDAVRQASEIKVQAQRQASAESGPTDGTMEELGGSTITTTIGFGPASAAFTSNATNTLSAQPQQQSMLVVKKKKKKRSIEEEDEDSKPQTVANVKRFKSAM
jgi:hypothetical protein